MKPAAFSLALLLGLALPAWAAEPIIVTSPWLRATPKGATVAGGYATITNNGATPDRLVGASLELAQRGEIHEMSMTGSVMHMRRLDQGLAIPPGATVTLSPGGTHIMFFNPKAQLREGQHVAGSLTFAKAGTVSVTFAVAGLAVRAAPGTASEPEGGMPGMKMDSMH